MIDPLLQEKARRIAKGEEVVLSDRDYEVLVDAGLFEDTWASMPNPQQAGTLDPWLVADLHKSKGYLTAARGKVKIV